jgi:hypothetical protein
MRRMLREFALAIGGVGLGIVLFMIASSHAYDQGAGWAIDFNVSWGYPLAWHYINTFGAYLHPTTFPIPGLNLGAVIWSAFYTDLLFWLALPIAATELSAHVAIPYLVRTLKLRREKLRTTVAAFGFVETPQ